MAKSKTKKRRTHKRSLSSGGVKSRRRARRSHKVFLSEMFNPTTAKNSFMGTLSAAAGGSGAAIAAKSILPPTAGKGMKILIAFAGGFLASNFGMPNLGSGFAGGMMALAFKDGVLSEDGETQYADPAALAHMPLYLDENDQPMVLEEGGNFRYLEDGEVNMLAEAGVLEVVED